MKTIVSFIFTLLIFISCDDSSQVVTYKNPTTEVMTTDTPPFRDLRDFPGIAQETDIDTLIAGMTSGDCVYSSAIGIAGTYTKEYACFERLCEIITDQELFALVKHKEPTVRLYAYKGLKKVNSTYLSDAKIMLKKDTAKVCLFSGCTQLTLNINFYID